MTLAVDPHIAFNNLALLPPKKTFENKEIYKQLIKTHRALAELKGYSEKLPNKTIILNSIVLQEAKDSSEIENIITSHDDLYKALTLKNFKGSSEAKEVLKYRKALFIGQGLIKEKQILSTNMIIEIQQVIEDNRAGLRKLPGTTLMNDKTGEVMYTPPDNYDDIIRLMKNFEIFLNNRYDEIDTLIKLAILHYQFEAIHPFYDGNGRTGRIINVLYLVMNDLLKEPFLYLSSYIIKNKSKYYNLLRRVTFYEEWEEWIMFMLTAIEETSLQTLKMSYKIVDSLSFVSEKIKSNHPHIYSKEFVEILFSNVYTKISDLVDNGIASRNIAAKYLKELEPDILKSEKIGRETLYINQVLFEILKKQ